MAKVKGLWSLSPSSLYNVIEGCPRCAWIEAHVGRAPGSPFRLNDAVDEKLKHRYDFYRHLGTVPPEIESSVGQLLLFNDQALVNRWRSSWRSLEYASKEVGVRLSGKLDEVFVTDRRVLVPADFKSSGDPPRVDKSKYAFWQLHAYAQMIKARGFHVADFALVIHYFVSNRDTHQLPLEFNARVDRIEIDLDAFKERLRKIVELFEGPIPLPDPDCRACSWYGRLRDLELENPSGGGRK